MQTRSQTKKTGLKILVESFFESVRRVLLEEKPMGNKPARTQRNRRDAPTEPATRYQLRPETQYYV